MAFGGFLKQDTAVDVLIGPFVDEDDGKTAETGLTIEDEHVLLSKNAQTLTAKSDTNDAAHDAIGYHNCPLGTGDTDTLGHLTLVVHVSGALPVRLDFQVVNEEVYESLYESTSIFDVLLRGNIHNTRHTFGWRMRRVSGGTEVVIASDTAQGAGTGNNQIQLASGAESTDDIYNGTNIAIIEGTGLGQTRTIFDYDGSSVTATVSRDWVTNPDATSVYNIYAASTSNVSHSGIAQSGGNTSIQLAADASDQDDYYNGSLVHVVAGTGLGQTRIITDYAGSSTTATVATWGVNPDNTSLYEVIPTSAVATDTPGDAPSVEEIRQELDVNSTKMATIASDLLIADTAIDKVVSDIIVLDAVADTIASDLLIADTAVDKAVSDIIVLDAVADTIASDILIVDTAIDKVVSDITVLDTVADTIASDILIADTAIDKAVSDIIVLDAVVDTIASDIILIDTEISMAISKSWAAAVELLKTAVYGGTDAVLAADQAYIYTDDIDLETDSYVGAQVLVELKINFESSRGLGAPAKPDDVIVDVFASLDGSIYDTIPFKSYPIKSRVDSDWQRFTFMIEDVAHFRLGLKTTGTDDTFDYRITHQRWKMLEA